MLSPQEIAGKEFVKAVFGGYDMSAVDDFLETVNADYSALYKENAILKSKIKVLVEKVEEYRSTEDAMRMALLTAQKMGEDIMTEANKKSAELLLSAERKAETMTAEMRAQLADEEARLNAARTETAKFVEASQELMRQHGAFLSRLEEIRHAAAPPAPEPEPTREEQVVSAAREIDSAVERIVAQQAQQPAAEAAPEASFNDEGEPTKRFNMKKAFGDEDEEDFTSPRPKFDFDNLKFGVNFKDEDDS